MPSPRITAAALVMALAPLAAPRQGSSQTNDDSVTLGVACGDRTFVPLAARTKGKWVPLIEADEGLWYFFANLTRQALRLPRQGWSLYPSEVGSPQALSLGSPRMRIEDSSECADAQAFEIDVERVRGRMSPYGYRMPTPITGIGVRGAPFDHLDDVTQQPDESSRRVAERIVQEVQLRERRLVRAAGSKSPLAPFSDRKEVRSVVRLVTMGRHRTGDGEWYFFQARKHYGEWYVFEGKRLYKRWASVLVHGWVHASPAGLSTFNVAGDFEDDDGKTVTYYRPKGVLRLDDRDVWITETSGYEWNGYELFEVGLDAQAPRSSLAVMTHGA